MQSTHKLNIIKADKIRRLKTADVKIYLKTIIYLNFNFNRNIFESEIIKKNLA